MTERKSPPFFSNYEMVAMVEKRVQQLSKESPLIETDLYDPIEIAKEEIRQRRPKLSVVRKFLDGTTESLSLQEGHFPRGFFKEPR